MSDRRGFAAVELTAAVALLLFPVLVLVATLPTWAEHRHVAVTVAREAAVEAAQSWPDPAAEERAAGAGVVVANTHGVSADDVQVSVVASPDRGGEIVATVRVRMPALALPGIGRVGSWHYSTTHSVRVDDYRSR